MADFDLGGLLFGNAPSSGFESYLDPEQLKRMQNQGVMQAAMALLKASGPSAVPVGIGQALGEAYGAGQTGYQQAQTQGIAGLLTKQKLDEALRKKRLEDFFIKGIAPTGDGASPMEQVSMPMAGAPIDPLQALSMPGYATGPTVERANLIGTTMPMTEDQASLAPVTVTGQRKVRESIFANLSQEQRMIAAMDPEKALPKLFEESLKQESFDTVTGLDAADLGLDPKGRYQINNRTGQVTTLQAPGESYEIVTGPEAIKFGLPGVGSYQVNKNTKQATLLSTAEGPFGGGTTGNAYNILLTEDPGSAKYALAFRELNKPVPTEEIQADGSSRVVYKQPAPLPKSFPTPTYAGRITVAPQNAVTIVQPSAVSAQPITSRAAPALLPALDISPTGGATAVPLPSGVKSTPMAPRPEEISKSRESINAGVDFVAALNKMENMVREQGMQLGGMGEKGASQTAIYEDLLTKARLAAQLGVLNKEDLPRLQAQLSDPTALSTYIRGLGGPSAFYSQIGELRSRIVEETTRKNMQFGQPIMQLPNTFSTIVPRPTTYAPPPIIKNILNKYPPRN